ncbi:MAG: tRNA epoxyqueuosine(34) reductase QueG, partial [Marinagarivorans sp.]|nr:tRNA epoxyqueuosine(34) reductase QueG [Marinagarivorans sp.]
MPPDFYPQLSQQIKNWGQELGFNDVGITDTDLSHYTPKLLAWLEKGYHGDMAWMADHGNMRYTPDALVPDTLRIISVRLNYLDMTSEHIKTLKTPHKAYIARYALGRDYHKIMRKRLATLATKINDYCSDAGLPNPTQRAFVDSAPVMERPLAEKAGLGWMGKNTLVINKEAGSWFFLGELFTSLPLITDNTDKLKSQDHCGSCTACLKVCPTDAFPTPYTLDAKRCISYLTIENKGSIPVEFREPMGNRIYGCDDCQAICPWNKYAQTSNEPDFKARHNLDDADLLELFLWDEATFLKNTEGSPIRRIGYEGWQRNIAVGLGNASFDEAIIHALKDKKESANAMVAEHIDWAIAQQIEQQLKPNKRRTRKIK